ncbi:large subunit GTPase 1 [Trichomonascus vanleenenianus]|uniref:ribosome biogenesis GTPase LSG1 n=1 Tax=Trichomonascus vanleenenianus TaxID=2268995 RepID=UPI003EC9FE66
MPKNNYGAQMGPKPGSRARNRAKNVSGLGRSLVNERKSKKKAMNSEDGFLNPTEEEPGWVKLQSVTQERALDEFLSTAELAGKDFTTERTQAVRIISHPQSAARNPYLPSEEEQQHQSLKQLENAGKLTVPRRPKWDSDMTKERLDRLERDAFLDWRRQLAMLQENHDLLLTPFERNIEVWRQLWRVVERSDLVVQIVDARNPLLFRSEDLEKYVKEIDPRKRNLLLINKADLMTLEQRKAWADYLIENKIRYAFFSAFTALKEVEKAVELEESKVNESDSEESEGEESESEESESEEVGEPKDKPESNTYNYSVMESDPTRILSVDQLEDLFLSEAPEPMYHPPTEDSPGRLQIGLVGYPNVGKSSTINALIGAKKVSVSSTPGKTKHFQTILLSPEVMLCDCPGLVFPNFAQTNADLVCNGVLPIDQLREFTAPTQLVAERIPKFFLEAVYGISIPVRPIEDGGTGVPTALELLYAYAKARGYMRTGQGTPDESRAARYVLKDYVNGKLLYCIPPPTYDDTPEKFNSQLYRISSLPETRQSQIISAIKDSRGLEESASINIDEVDLAKELESLKFSQHDPLSSRDNLVITGTFSEGSELDRDFFASTSGLGHSKLPFHLQKKQGGNGKKHFKGKKGKAMMY